MKTTDIGFERFKKDFYADVNTMYIKPNNLNDELVYNKTFEEEMEEQRKIKLAISHLEGFGVEVVSEYGFYRNIYNVLKDLGECLDKPCVKCCHHNWDMPECKECGPRNNYKYFVGSEI